MRPAEPVENGSLPVAEIFSLTSRGFGVATTMDVPSGTVTGEIHRLIHDIGQKVADFQTACRLARKHIPGAVAEHAGETAKGLLHGLVDFAIDAAKILAASTAVGALIGALFGGVMGGLVVGEFRRAGIGQGSSCIKADEIGAGGPGERHDQPVGSGDEKKKPRCLDREQDPAIGKHAIAVERGAENVKKAQRGSFHGLSDGRLRPAGRAPREAATNKEGRLGKD